MENSTYLNATDCTDLSSEMLDADSQMRCWDPRYLRTMLFGVYLLIRKRARLARLWRVLHYTYRLLAVYVCLLANIRAL
jgi:hypothetical protein